MSAAVTGRRQFCCVSAAALLAGIDEGHLSRHMGSLLRDLGAPDLPADSQGASDGPAPWVNPDAGLIALCSEAVKLDAEEASLVWSEDAGHPAYADRPGAASKIAFAAVQKRYYDALGRIATTPAETLAGFGAKARVLLAFWGDTLPEEDTAAGDVLASLLHDLAGDAA
jgi:hypothetical protein